MSQFFSVLMLGKYLKGSLNLKPQLTVQLYILGWIRIRVSIKNRKFKKICFDERGERENEGVGHECTCGFFSAQNKRKHFYLDHCPKLSLYCVLMMHTFQPFDCVQQVARKQ